MIDFLIVCIQKAFSDTSNLYPVCRGENIQAQLSGRVLINETDHELLDYISIKYI